MNDAGYTLMELLVVLTILATVAIIGAPAIARIMPGQVLNAEMRLLASQFKTARLTAILTNEETMILIDTRQDRVGDITMKQAHTLPHNAQIEAETTQGAQKGIHTIRFFPDGTSSGGRITLRLDEIIQIMNVEKISGRAALSIP